jgi:nucleoside-diphosphate-sugar epimerase
MNLLVSGSTGFIGSYFCKNETNFEVVKLDSKIRINKYCGSFSSLQEPLKNCDVFLHLAGLAHGKFSESELRDTNLLGTLGLAVAAAKAGVKRFVFVSSVNVHGSDSGEFPFTEKSDLRHSINLSNLEAEKGLKEIGKETGMEVTIVRSVLVYGADAPGNMGLLMKVVSKLPFTPFGIVRNKRSFISIGNLCDFLSLCASHPEASNEVFLVSDDKVVSTPELMNAFALGLGRKIYHLPIPAILLRLLGKLSGKSKQVDQLVGNLQVDVSKAKSLLGWAPIETMEQAMCKLK